jgi:hypothetical protein
MSLVISTDNKSHMFRKLIETDASGFHSQMYELVSYCFPSAKRVCLPGGTTYIKTIMSLLSNVS